MQSKVLSRTRATHVKNKRNAPKEENTTFQIVLNDISVGIITVM